MTNSKTSSADTNLDVAFGRTLLRGLLGQQQRADLTSKRVMIVRRGHKLCAGYVSYNVAQGGWKFLPQFQARPSRKFWPTADAAVKGRVKDYTLEDAR